MDFRCLENRKEGFIRYYVWQLRTTDCDPSLSLLNYIFKRQELNIEQKLWLIWLYGNTYYLPTSYMIWNEFPDYENVDQERLEKWNSKNYKKLRYQVDNKWQKGHLPTMFKSYKEYVGDSQLEFFQSLSSSQDPFENYENVRKAIVKNFFKFGRYLSWFYMQTLEECAGLPIEAPNLLFSDSGSASHRDGMCYVVGRDDWTSKYYDESGKKVKRKIKYDAEKVALLDLEAKNILDDISRRFKDVKANYYTMETALCSYKKLFRRRDGRYLGYYLDRQAEEIRRVESDGWCGVEWSLLWDYRREKLNPDLGGRDARIDKSRMLEFPDTGILNLLDIYKDLT